eukprot:14821714-Heterocapsa_arctica.AAC.1
MYILREPDTSTLKCRLRPAHGWCCLVGVSLSGCTPPARTDPWISACAAIPWTARRDPTASARWKYCLLYTSDAADE